MSKNVLEQAAILVQAQITKRLHSSIARLPGTIALLKDLSIAGQRLTKSFDDIKEVGYEFRMGVVETLATLDAFRSGYASNGKEVSLDEQASAALAAKSAGEVESAVIKLFDERFVAAVKAESDAEALGALRVLREMLTKALNWEDTGAVTPTVTKDPAQTTPTSEAGSIEALQAQHTNDAQTYTVKADEVSWPRDLAKNAFAGAQKAPLVAAVAAIEKASELEFKGWDMDMAPRARR